jgi:anti-sigma B factor antagonist
VAVMRPESPLSVTLAEEDGIAVVRAVGDLDLATAPQLVRAINAACAGRRPRVLADLAALDFCDSAGLRALLGAAREVEARAGRLVVAVAPGGAVDRVLELAGLREFLRVRPPAEARAALH